MNLPNTLSTCLKSVTCFPSSLKQQTFNSHRFAGSKSKIKVLTNLVSGEVALFFFLGPYLQHMEVPELGVDLELQLLACATATAMPVPSHVCNLWGSFWQRQILNPLSKARDWTQILMDTSQVLDLLSQNRTSKDVFFCLFVCFCLFAISWAIPMAYGCPRLGIQSEL